MTKEELEGRILRELQVHADDIKHHDDVCQELYNEHMSNAATMDNEYFKMDEERKAQWNLGCKKHGYDFLEGWKNSISKAMYGRVYSEWHSAQAGRYKGTGHGAYVTTELSEKEQDNINKVFEGLVKRNYIKLSRSGKMATFNG